VCYAAPSSRSASHLKLASRGKLTRNVQDFERKAAARLLSQVTSDDQLSGDSKTLVRGKVAITRQGQCYRHGQFDGRACACSTALSMTFYAEEWTPAPGGADVLNSFELANPGREGVPSRAWVVAAKAWPMSDTVAMPTSVLAPVFLDEAFSIRRSRSVPPGFCGCSRSCIFHVNLNYRAYKEPQSGQRVRRSLVIADANPDSHESHFVVSLTWEEIDQTTQGQQGRLQ